MEAAAGFLEGSQSRRGNRFVRARRRAGAAVNALVGVDRVGGTLGNSLGRAGVLAAAAANALVSVNLVSQFRISLFGLNRCVYYLTHQAC